MRARVGVLIAASLLAALLSATAQAPTPVVERITNHLGRTTREVLNEAVSESLGSVAGEGVMILSDVLNDQYKGGLKEALTRMGQAGLRDMVGGAGRSAALSRRSSRICSAVFLPTPGRRTRLALSPS